MKRGLLLLLFFAGSLFACTLPGASSPTPFAFPTPDITLTAMAGEIETEAAPTRVVAASATPEVAGTPTPQDGEPTSQPDEATAEPTLTLAPGTTDTRPNGQPLDAEALSSAPTIDADLSDWDTSARSLNAIVFGASNWSGASDASASYHIGWTSDALYVAVRVTDDSFVQVSSGSQMYKGDIVELQLDRDLEGDYFSNTLSGDDYQIGLSPGNFGSLGSSAWRWYPIGTHGLLSGVTLASAKTDAGYIIEAKIPWSVFGVTPSSGARFGFALSVSDNDLAGAPVQQSMVSTVSSRTLTNPTTWGTLVLTGGASSGGEPGD